jgi:hypothetical protein
MNGCESVECMQGVAAKLSCPVKNQRLADIYTWDPSIPRGSWARHVMPWGCLDLDMDGTSIMGFTYSHGQSPAECSAPLPRQCHVALLQAGRECIQTEGSCELHALLAVAQQRLA